MKISLTVEIDTDERKKLGLFLFGINKPVSYATCKAAFLGAIDNEKDSWFIEAAEGEERDSDREYNEYQEEVKKRCGEK